MEMTKPLALIALILLAFGLGYFMAVLLPIIFTVWFGHEIEAHKPDDQPQQCDAKGEGVLSPVWEWIDEWERRLTG